MVPSEENIDHVTMENSYCPTASLVSISGRDLRTEHDPHKMGVIFLEINHFVIGYHL